MKQEKITEAVECYSRAIELDNNNAVYYCNRFVTYYTKKYLFSVQISHTHIHTH